MRLIDADAVKDEINKAILKVHEFVRKPEIEIDEEMKIRVEQEIATYCEASLFVSKAPTVDAVPVRHGTWQKVGSIDSTWLVYKCSVCNGQTIDGGNYCPNCGAKMDAERKEE